MVNEETVYSTPWKPVKTRAKKTVASIPFKAPLLFPCIKEWCAYVTVTPDDSNIQF